MCSWSAKPWSRSHMTKLYGYDRMTMVLCLIKGYIERNQSRIVIVIYKHIAMYVNIYINFNISKVKKHRENVILKLLFSQSQRQCWKDGGAQCTTLFSPFLSRGSCCLERIWNNYVDIQYKTCRLSLLCFRETEDIILQVIRQGSTKFEGNS